MLVYGAGVEPPRAGAGADPSRLEPESALGPWPSGAVHPRFESRSAIDVERIA